MHRCLVRTEELLAETCSLGREAARHLQTVLRVRPGDPVMLFDGRGRTRAATVSAADRCGLTLTAAGPALDHPRPACALSLFACVSKGAHMDWTVEKATELGATRIVPVISARTVSRPSDAALVRIAEGRPGSAAPRGCLRFRPRCSSTRPSPSPRRRSPLFCGRADARSPAAARRAGRLPGAPTAGWFVGPEGDFTPAELAALADAGATPVSLGPQVLRAETACLYGLCALSCAWLT